MNEHKAIPNIRFKGFENKWELSKLGNDLISIHTGTNLLGSETPGGTPLIKMGNLKNGFFDFSKLDYLPICENVKNEDKVGFGDFLFNTRNTLDLVGKGATWMYESTKFAYNNNIAKFNFQNSIDTVFFNYLYNTYNVMNQIHARATGTTSVAAIYPKSLDSITYNLPSKQEQQKIGNFFTKLDKLLDLQQQKIDKLELLKKALLQKLFPKHDAQIPELRFKGFNDEWKKEKLSKLGHTFSGLSGKNKKDFGHGKAKYITYMNVFKNPLTSKTGLDNIELDSKQHTVKYGDVLFTMSSETPEEVGMSSVWKYHLENIYLNSFSFGYRHSTKFDLNFLAFMFRSQVMREQIKILAQGISRYNISKNKMMDILAYFPTESEQQKIGNLLSKVYQLIELENKKLQNFQQVKKCLLQNMFVE